MQEVYTRAGQSSAAMPIKPPDPHLELTDDVIMLRAPTADDAESVAQLVLDSVTHLQPWLPWATSTYTAESALEYFSGRVDATAHAMLIFDGKGQLVGGAGLNRFDMVNRVADLGYWVARGHTGQGYATRATNLLAKHAIETVGLERLELIMSVYNKASIRVAEKSIAMYEGLQKNRLHVGGVQHDAHCYVVLNKRS